MILGRPRNKEAESICSRSVLGRYFTLETVLVCDDRLGIVVLPSYCNMRGYEVFCKKVDSKFLRLKDFF